MQKRDLCPSVALNSFLHTGKTTHRVTVTHSPQKSRLTVAEYQECQHKRGYIKYDKLIHITISSPQAPTYPNTERGRGEREGEGV